VRETLLSSTAKACRGAGGEGAALSSHAEGVERQERWSLCGQRLVGGLDALE
jgi:hypothetical protein